MTITAPRCSPSGWCPKKPMRGSSGSISSAIASRRIRRGEASAGRRLRRGLRRGGTQQGRGGERDRSRYLGGDVPRTLVKSTASTRGPGDAQAIPLPDRSIDVVVSFETIEHVPDPAAFLRECVRVLTPAGTLIVSSPNRPVYSEDHGANPYHRIEFDEDEFVDLLRTRFGEVQLYGQFPQSAAWWSPRSLAAERSPWLRIRGFWRLSSWICPAIRTEVSPADREAADKLILGRSGFPRSLFNPYVVRSRSKQSRERPYILVAVARRPRFT